MPEPSRADEFLTQSLKSALLLVDVRVLDHLVVTSNAVVSFAGLSDAFASGRPRRRPFPCWLQVAVSRLSQTVHQDLKCAAVRRVIAHLSGSRVLPVLRKSRSARPL